MGNIDDTYTFFLRINFKGIKEPVVIEIRKKDVTRFKNNLAGHNDSGSFVLFFVCDTIDGKCIGINLSEIQSLNILWEPTPYMEDQKHYEGPIKYLLKNREEFIETYTDNPEELHDFYSELQHGPDIVGSFASFTDEDGEDLFVNIKELSYIEAPSELTDEGWGIVKKRDGIDE